MNMEIQIRFNNGGIIEYDTLEEAIEVFLKGEEGVDRYAEKLSFNGPGAFSRFIIHNDTLQTWEYRTPESHK